MTRPIQASLDLQALKQNLSIVRQAATHARVWSVVKANAYGHGIERIWSAIGATDGFALLNLEEAITLRERGWKGPILMLEGFFHAQDLEIYDQHRLGWSVGVRCPIRRRLCGTRKRILTGFGLALFCMALRRPVSGVISPIPDYVR